MDINNLKKIEIGCGKTKIEGYIGVDRFPLEGVDIVADINKCIPFEENSVDVVFASHSLEHMDDLQQVMNEIFRICRHGAIVNILAPYYNTNTNIANFFHKINFNEDTMRFFSSDKTSVIDPEEYYNAHSYNWGLGTSDNSEMSCNLTILNMEFFYFPEYNFLSEIEKRNARRALSNICDQIYYSLVVNKEEKPFESFEIEYYERLAKKLTPPIVEQVRKNSSKISNKGSFYRDVFDRIKIEGEERLKIKEELESLSLKIKYMENYFYENHNTTKKEIDNKIGNIMDDLKLVKNNNMETLPYIQELMISNQSKRKKIFFIKKHDIFESINTNSSRFCDDLVIKQVNFNKKSILGFSNLIPFDKYIEYELLGTGTQVTYFISAKNGSLFMVEVVNNGQIVHNDVVEIEKEGYQVFRFPNASGLINIRFRAMNNSSLGRVLEIKNRKFIIFSKSHIAAYID